MSSDRRPKSGAASARVTAMLGGGLAALVLIAIAAPAAAQPCPPGPNQANCLEQLRQQQQQRQQQMLLQQQRQQQLQIQQQQRQQQIQLQQQRQQQMLQQQQRQQQLQIQQQQQQQQRQQQIELQRQQQLQQQRQQIESQRQQQLQQQRQRQIELQRQQQLQQQRQQIESQRQQQLQQRQQQLQQQRQQQIETQHQQQLQQQRQQQIETLHQQQLPQPPQRQVEPRRPPPQPQQAVKPIQIDPATRIVRQPQQRRLTVTRTLDRSREVVVGAQVLPNGRKQVVAYTRIKNPAAGTETRVYLDGRRTILGRDFVTRAGPRQLTVTTRRDGLRQASLPNGRPVFRERLGMVNWHGREHRAIIRTVSTALVGGAAIALARPIERVYLQVPFRGVVIDPYVPVVFPAAFYAPFWIPFPVPVAVGPDCPFCPPPVLDFGEPVTAYADPVDLLADWVLADAIADADSDALAAAPPDPEVAALSDQVAALQQQLVAAESANDELKSELADQQVQIDALREKPPPPPPGRAPVRIPPDVRAQIRREVKADIELHQKQQPLSLADIIASAQAQDYVFQASELIDATADSGETCALTGGDLLKFERAPGANDVSAPMRVVSSKAGSCAAGTVVTVSLKDLQDMLNAFSERLEDGMQRVHDKLAAAQPR